MGKWWCSDDGCASQRTHPAKISDGRTEKKGPGGKRGERPASRLSQLGLLTKRLEARNLWPPVRADKAEVGAVLRLRIQNDRRIDSHSVRMNCFF